MGETGLLPELRLRRGEEQRIEGGHPWVFSNEVDTGATPLAAFAPGARVRVVSARDRFLGYAYVNPHALICARILGRDPQHPPSRGLLVHRLQVALALRERFHPRPYYRLVFGESDGLPGLVLDRYGDLIVGQASTAGMDALADDVVAAVRRVLPIGQFVWKNDGGARELENLPERVTADTGEVPADVSVEADGLRCHAPLASGQKTGWFYDQAANRRALVRYVAGRRVLDVFSYVGAWGLAAAAAGASEVLCVDASATALAAAARSAADNGLQLATQRGDAFDVLTALHAAGERFDVVILDPPAFIKRRRQIPKGEAAYRRLNQLGLQLLARDGILVSCSCSYHLAPESLLAAIQKAARHTGRFVQVLECGGQAPDHPVHPAIPETRYLKAFFCRAVPE
ncbi:MAG: class I SAM-dependent rRNA methyltransferase [Gammaproteobacteria bacterium]|nr:class I SAM-dependent rRNA methyltransferase [Gammaproteobacteria bacterium]